MSLPNREDELATLKEEYDRLVKEKMLEVESACCGAIIYKGFCVNCKEHAVEEPVPFTVWLEDISS